MSLPSLQSQPQTSLRPVKALSGTAAISILPSQSGTYFTLNQATTMTVNLPAPASCAGAYFRFTVIGSAANAMTVNSTAANMSVVCLTPMIITGAVTAVTGGVYSNGGALGTTITFLANAGNGTFLDIYSDGTTWNGVAVSAKQAAGTQIVVLS